jgi:hypothetical protein
LQDPQGVHVIEKIISCFEEELIESVYETIIDNYVVLANDCNGLCAAKKIIMHATIPSTVSNLIKKLIDNGLSLVQNSFGNYAIQCAIDVK